MSLSNKILNKINEMAESKKDIVNNIYSKERMISEHLIKCCLYQKSESLEHWKTEVFGFVNVINKLKNTNKYPTYNQLKHWIIDRFEDSLLDRIDGYVSDIVIKYGKVEYDKESLYQVIIRYFIWLLQSLSEKGYITRQDVSKEIDSLIKEYTKLQ